MATKVELETENEALRAEALRVALLVEERDDTIAALEARIASLESSPSPRVADASPSASRPGKGYTVTNPGTTALGASIRVGEESEHLRFPPGASSLSEEQYRRLSEHPDKGVRAAFSELFAPRGPLQIGAVV